MKCRRKKARQMGLSDDAIDEAVRFHTKNDEFHSNNDEFHTTNDEFHTKNDEFHTKNDEFYKNDADDSKKALIALLAE